MPRRNDSPSGSLLYLRYRAFGSLATIRSANDALPKPLWFVATLGGENALWQGGSVLIWTTTFSDRIATQLNAMSIVDRVG